VPLNRKDAPPEKSDQTSQLFARQQKDKESSMRSDHGSQRTISTKDAHCNASAKLRRNLGDKGSSFTRKANSSHGFGKIVGRDESAAPAKKHNNGDLKSSSSKQSVIESKLVCVHLKFISNNYT
jgi:hypothetical protein